MNLKKVSLKVKVILLDKKRKKRKKNGIKNRSDSNYGTLKSSISSQEKKEKNECCFKRR